MLELTNNILVNFFQSLGSYLPSLFGGIVILVIGLLIGGIVKHVLVTVLNFLKVEALFERAKLFKKSEVKIWENVLIELLKWALIIVFLVPALEVWGLSQATVFLNEFLIYLPNVIIAVVIGFVGLLAANLVSDLVRHSVRSIGATSANSLAVFTKGAITFFTVLVVLNQLGVAQDLIRILFTGIVAMLALAGGLAFGLGGQDFAKEILDELKRKLK